MFTPGDKLEYGHYTVLRELGAGGMGVVYHCRDEFLQREIAIKMLLPELMSDDDTVEVFRQEARLAAQLEHPNVVTIHNIGMENRESKVHHYIAMEFLPGGSLKSRIRKDEVSLEQALEWMKQLAVGLNYAHKRGVVHQDIKPDNIFITHDATLKIGDFGLALIATGVAVERAVQGKGTPAYMSPELCRGDPQDHRSDIYSLGAVFFEMLTKERPYKASGMIEMALKHATAPIPSAKKFNASVPDVLDKAIQKMMAKGKEERYSSLAEVLPILEMLLLEMQVARLGVGKATAFTSVAEKPAAPPPQPQPKPKPLAQKTQAEKDVDRELDDSLDDLLDTLLSEKSSTEHHPQAQPQTQAEAPPEPTLSPRSKDVTTRMQQATIGQTFQEDITGDVDSVFQSAVRQRVESAGKQAVPPQAPANAAGSGVAGKSAAEPMTGNPRVSHSGLKPVGDIKEPAQVWNFKTRGPIGWSSMPVVSRDRKSILIASSDGSLYCLDAAKGTVIWRFDTGAAILSSPVINGPRIYIANAAGSFYCLDHDGNEVWVHNFGSPIAGTPACVNDNVVLSALDGSVCLVDGKGGDVKWKYFCEGPVVSSAQVIDDLVIVGSRDNALRALSLDKGWRQWQFETRGPIVASPIVSSDSVYVGSVDGCFYALEAESGRQIWKYGTEKPIVSRGTLELSTVTIASEDKTVYCLEKYKGAVVWKSNLQGRVMTNLVSSVGNLYAATREGFVQCFNVRNGELKWQIDCGKRFESTPLVSGKLLYVASVSGDLAAYSVPGA